MRRMSIRCMMAFLAVCILLIGWLLSVGVADETIMVDAGQYPVLEDGSYSTMQEVAVYMHTYGRLPNNFITKKQAQTMGWNSREGNLKDVAPGYSIGGDHFGNYEENPDLPSNQKWMECDIDSTGGYRGAKRMVFSSDGRMYYSSDHYTTFVQVCVQASEGKNDVKGKGQVASSKVEKGGAYTSREDVADYLRRFGELPVNYLTRKEAKKLGWSAKKDNLGELAPGCAIGGDLFGNREGLLPQKEGRTWKECDVNTEGGRRSKERIVFSNDGLVYYSPDAHRTFEQLP